MTADDAIWTYDPERSLRGLGGVTLAAPLRPDSVEQEVVAGVLEKLNTSFNVVPYEGVAVVGRRVEPSAGTFGAAPSQAITSRFPEVAGELCSTEHDVDGGARLQVVALLLAVSPPAAAYMLLRQDAVIVLVPSSAPVDPRSRACDLVRAAEFVERTEDACKKLMGGLATEEALMVPEGSHDDRHRTLRLFCGRGALSRIQGSRHKMWRPLISLPAVEG